MDAAVFILIKNISNEIGLVINQKKHSFGGKEYLQDEICYYYESEKVFTESQLSEWVYLRIPNHFKREEYICLLLDDKILDKLEVFKNNLDSIQEIDKYSSIIKKLLQSSNEWALIFLEQWDRIDESAKCDYEEAINRLLVNLDWNNQRIGFAYYSS